MTCKMASEGFTEVDFTCPVCFDFFINPVVLNCSHSICSDCIQAFWESKGINECPMCREISSVSEPPLNLALKNLCETFQQERSQRSSSGGDEAVCSAHNEKLKLFCLDDQQAVCLVCRDSKLHTDHSFCPIDEAVYNNKEKLKAVLEQLQEKKGLLDNFKQTLDRTADINKNQTKETEEKISKEFEELREILRNEEVARITVLREEEEQKSEQIKEKTKNTSKQIISIRCAIRDVEKQMKAGDDSFLQSFKSTLQSADPGSVEDLLINTQEYLSNLRLTVCQKIDSSRGDPSVRGATSNRQGHGFRGGTNARGGPTTRGGFRGVPSFRGGGNFKGEPSNRGHPGFQGEPGFNEGPTPRGGFRGDPGFRGAGHFKGEPSNRGHPGFQGEPGFNEGPTPRGGFRGDPGFRGAGHFKGEPSNRGYPGFQGEPGFNEGPTPRGGFRGDSNFSGGHNFMGNANTRGDHRGHTEGPHRFRGGRNDRGAHNPEEPLYMRKAS